MTLSKNKKKYTSLAEPALIYKDSLFLSSKTAANNFQTLGKYGITHVVSVCHEASEIFEEKGLTYLIINDVNDTIQDRNKLKSYIKTVNSFIHETLNDPKNKLLIHCNAGVSRSVTLLALYLITVTGEDHESVLKFIKSKRVTANPNSGFRLILSNFEISGEAKFERDRLELSEFEELNVEE